jgi:hypothetical protein
MAKHGPNVNKLIIRKASLLAVPAGGGLADGIKFFTDAEHRKKILGEAETWVVQAIEVVKTAPDNPYGHDAEAIAAALLAKIEERKPGMPKRTP